MPIFKFDGTQDAKHFNTAEYFLVCADNSEDACLKLYDELKKKFNTYMYSYWDYLAQQNQPSVDIGDVVLVRGNSIVKLGVS